MPSNPLVEVLGWLAFGLNVWGNLAIGNRSAKGFIVRLACNATWLVYSAATGAWPLFGNHAVFAAINIHCYRKWMKEDATPKGGQP